MITYDDDIIDYFNKNEIGLKIFYNDILILDKDLSNNHDYMYMDNNNIYDHKEQNLQYNFIQMKYLNVYEDINFDDWDYIEEPVMSHDLVRMIGNKNIEDMKVLNCYGRGIYDLNGVKKLKNLYSINCSYNHISNLDTTGLNLKFLYCDSNDLVDLKVGHVKYLNCSYNDLTELDLSETTGLRFIFCNDNRLTDLKLGETDDLAVLHCWNNNFSHESREELIRYCNRNGIRILI